MSFKNSNPVVGRQYDKLQELGDASPILVLFLKMGSINYLIVPKLKLKIPTRLSLNNGFPEYRREKFDKVFNNEELERGEYGGLDYPDPDKVKLNTLGDLTISDATKLFNIAKILDDVVNPMYMEEILCYYLDTKGIDFFTISEYQEEDLKKYSDFIVLE